MIQATGHKQRLCVLTVLAVVVLAGNGMSQSVSPQGREPMEVGMVALLSNPQRYDGKLIRTIGFACLEYESDALYLHVEDYQYQNDRNALALRLTKEQRTRFKKMSLRHVIVEGTMYADGLEATEFGGSIGNITRFDAWPARGDIPAPPGEAPSRCSVLP